MIDKFSILNGAKYFSSGIFQNYLVFIPAKDILLALFGFNRGNHRGVVECLKKGLKI